MTNLLIALFLLVVLWMFWSVVGLIYPYRPFRTRGQAFKSLGTTFALCIVTIIAIDIIGNNKTSPNSATGKSPLPADPLSAEIAPAEVAAEIATEREKSRSSLNEGIALATGLPEACGNGGAAFNDIYAVSGDHDLRIAPGTDADRIKNSKASAILGEVQYHQIDSSVTVRRLCAQDEWTQIRIVTPEWLTDVNGWVPNSALREIERTADGGRLFVEDDFYWDDDTSRHKNSIITLVNRIARENKRCGVIDPSSVAKSPSRSKSGDPVFFVTCGEGADVFNVWFRPTEASSETKFLAVEPLGRSEAAGACERAAKSAATHPSTVSFSRVWDLAYVPHASGRARIISSFTAKNAFDLELKYRISCLFEGPSMIETLISEATD